MARDYDVIIVGGRVAGSTLAAYLGLAGMRVLLLERAQLPAEHPASSPMIQPVTMSMLDEIGANEADYARNTPKIYRMNAIDGDIKMQLELPEIGGRNYGYALDRARFDAALWDNAVRMATVDGIMNFSVTNLLWNDSGESVVGVEGKRANNSNRERFTAYAVIGADGRFSTVARKADARERNQHDQHPTSLYYGYWKNVTPFDDSGESTSTVYGTEANTHAYLIMDSADGTAAVCIEGRSDVVAPEKGQLDDFYLEMLKQQPEVWERIQDAELVTSVHGMRKIGNFYRDAGGAGWALVGDAYHQKDPIDGQGIYDAVFTARTLAQALVDWHTGEKTWDEAIAWYDEHAQAHTTPQYEMTLFRVQQSLYPSVNISPMAKKLLETPVRWLTKDHQFRRRAGLALNRQIDPRKAADARFVAIAMLRGSLRELSEKLGEYETEPAEKN